MGKDIQPLVSVILPINKFSPYFPPALESILNQTYQNIEVLIVINGRDESIQEYLSSKKDARIRVIKTDLQQISFAINLGLLESKAELIARMDADDISENMRLERQVEFLIKNQNIAVLGTQYQRITGDDKKLGEVSSLQKQPYQIKKNIYYGSNIAHPSVVFRKSAVLSCGGYHGDFAEDYDLWIRMIHAGYNLSNLDECLLKYRIHDGQMTDSKKNTLNFYKLVTMKFRYCLLHADYQFLIGITYDLLFYLYRKMKFK